MYLSHALQNIRSENKTWNLVLVAVFNDRKPIRSYQGTVSQNYCPIKLFGVRQHIFN